MSLDNFPDLSYKTKVETGLEDLEGYVLVIGGYVRRPRNRAAYRDFDRMIQIWRPESYHSHVDIKILRYDAVTMFDAEDMVDRWYLEVTDVTEEWRATL